MVQHDLRAKAAAIAITEDFTRKAGRRPCHALSNQFPEATAIAAAKCLVKAPVRYFFSACPVSFARIAW